MNEHPARPAELLDDDIPNAMAPLLEEEDTPPLSRFQSQVPANNPTHRRLRAIAGAGNAYVFMVLPDTGGQVALEFFGVEPTDLPVVLRTVADAVEVKA